MRYLAVMPRSPQVRSTILALLAVAALRGQDDRPAIDPRGVAGARLICGGGALPDEVLQRFVALAGGDERGAGANVLLVVTATARATDADYRAQLLGRWRERAPAAAFGVVHAASRDEADTAGFAAPLHAATGVWFVGGQQQRLAATYVGTRFEAALQQLVARGGVVGGTSAGAAIQSRAMIQSGNPVPVLAQGLDLVPDAIVDQHFTARDRLPRLLDALRRSPGRFGLGVDERTAVELRGRQLRVLGDGAVTLALAAGAGRAERVERVPAGQRADLVTWQRAARDRAGPPWPPAAMAPPRVPDGALVIAGGGRLPDAVIGRFVELAGGADARVVVVPTASARPPGDGTGAFGGALRRRGVADVRVFHWTDPGAASDEQLAALADATAVWFGGGRQWRLWDAYADTEAVAAFRAVLARGGVIGGSSAGATIQGEFLVRGNPLGNEQQWCEGYDRGFAFLPSCAIDQHFVARDRVADLRALIEVVPQVIGLGVDEGTAIVVQGDGFEVVGNSKVAVFDWRRELPPAAERRPVWLDPGARWDLVQGSAVDAGQGR